jgi:glutaryl-CoA dehydrogenase
LLNIDALLSDRELEVRGDVRSFGEDEIKPSISEWWEEARFPKEIVPKMGERGLLGMHLEGYGCPGKSAVEYGLACMELEAGDSGLRTFVSVQGSLTMSAIHKFGSEEHKQEWLPKMAKGEAIGCFSHTEPTAGSEPASMRAFARKDGSDWDINGEKRWIGMVTIADAAVDWAQTDDKIRGFLVPTDAPGFGARDIKHKVSMRASIQCGLFLEDVRLPEDAMLPDAKGLSGPFACLNEARYGIIWGSMGAGEIATSARSSTRKSVSSSASQ